MRIGVLDSNRTAVVERLVGGLISHLARTFKELILQPHGKEFFFAAAKKHAEALRSWKPNIVVEVLGVPDFAWVLYEKLKESRDQEDRDVVRYAYRALATMMILKAKELLPPLQSS